MQKAHNRTLALAAFMAALSLPTLVPVPALADIPGQHPHYLHALSDLRQARALLGHPDESNVRASENVAVTEINSAISEIKRAAIDDGKNLTDHPAIDTKLPARNRFQEALDLLQRADQDLGFKEDNQQALGWRKLAIQHDRKAITYVRWALRTDKFDDSNHP